MSSARREPMRIRWCFTWNNYENNQQELERFRTWVQGPDTKMVIIGEETAPTTGTKHLQGYLELTKQRRITELKKLSQQIHWEGANGTRTQNYEYCSKEGNIWYEKQDAGKWSTSRAQDDKWQQIRDLARLGQLSEIEAQFPHDYILYRGAMERMAAESTIAKLQIFEGDLQKKNVWIWGEPGVGKSKWANNKYDLPAIYRKMANKWWDGYNILNHKLVLIEDWPSVTQLDMGHFMKLWSDRYPFRGECKGGMVTVDPKVHIVVTSNYPISQCFTPTDVPAIQRRFCELNMTAANQVLINSMNFD